MLMMRFIVITVLCFFTFVVNFARIRVFWEKNEYFLIKERNLLFFGEYI